MGRECKTSVTVHQSTACSGRPRKYFKELPKCFVCDSQSSCDEREPCRFLGVCRALSQMYLTQHLALSGARAVVVQPNELPTIVVFKYGKEKEEAHIPQVFNRPITPDIVLVELVRPRIMTSI